MASRVQIVIEVDADKAGQAVGQVRSALQGLGGTTVQVTQQGTQAFGQFTGSITGSILKAQLAVAAIEKIGGAMKSLTVESALVAARNETLNVSLEAVGRANNVSTVFLNRQREALERLGITEAKASQALSRLVTSQLDVTRATELARLAQNAAIVANENSSQALEGIVAGIVTQQVELLRTRGILVNFEAEFRKAAATMGKTAEQLTELEKKQIAFNAVLEQAPKFAGIYESALETVGKRLTSLDRQIEQAKVAVGQEFKEELLAAVGGMELFAKAAEIFPRMAGLLTELGTTAVTTFAAFRLGGPIAAAVVGIPQLGIIAIQELLRSYREAKLGFQSLFAPNEAGAGIVDAALGAAEEANRLGLARLEEEMRKVGERTNEIADRNKKRNEEALKALAERAKLLDQISRIEGAALQRGADEITGEVLRTSEALETLQEIRSKAPGLTAEVNRAIEIVQDTGTKAILEILAKQAEEEIKLAERAEKEIAKIRAQATAETIEEYTRRAEVFGGILSQTLDLEARNTRDTLDRFQQIEFDRLSALADLSNKVNAEIERTGENSVELQELAARQTAAINARAGIDIQRENQRIFDEQARLIERNAQQFELFWDRVTRGAKSTADFLSNLWNELANQFRRFVLQSVAQWIFGQRQIAATAGGTAAGVGGFAGLLGAIFGTPGIASARTPPFVSSFLGAGGGLTSAAGAIPGVAGGAGAGAGAIPLGIPGLGSAGIPGLAGGLPGGGAGVPAALGLLLGLEGARRGRVGLAAGLGVGGVLGGVALSGVAAGVAGGVGGLAGAGVALAGFLTNPIGLAILGGVAGVAALVGVIQRGRKKEDATRIANEGFAEITELVARYSQHAATYDATIQAMNRIWSQMEAAWRQIGGSVGTNSIRDQRRYFDQYVKQVEDIERERQRRGVLISNLPVPQFQSGGLVGPLGGMVHPGEFVIRREVVQETGIPMLQRINQGAPAGGDTYNVEIRTVDQTGIESLIRNHWDAFKRAIVAMVRQSRGEFGLR